MPVESALLCNGLAVVSEAALLMVVEEYEEADDDRKEEIKDLLEEVIQ